MAVESSQNNFKKGLTAMCILAVLKQEDMYGYQIVQAIDEYSNGKMALQEGTVYPSLYRLQQLGMISGHKVLVGKRMSRIYYHLEPKGAEYFTLLYKEYEDVCLGVRLLLNEGGDDEYE